MTTLSGRLDRLSKWRAPDPAPAAFFVVVGQPTPAQVRQIAQARAAGRKVQVLKVVVVPCATDPGGGNGADLEQ